MFRLGKIVTEHPRWILFIALIVIFVSSAGIRKLNFNNNYRAYFSEENPQLKVFETIQKTYSKSDNVLFVVEPDDGNVFSPKALQAIHELTTKAWKLPFSSRVDSITNFQHTAAKDDELIVADLISVDTELAQEKILSIKQIVLNEPLLVNRLISKDGRVAGVNVITQLPDKSPMEVVDVATEARKMASDIETAFPGIKVHLTGIVMMNNAFVEAAIHDNKTIMPLMYAIVIVVAYLNLRSVTAVICIILMIVFSVTSAVGIFSWLNGLITPPSAVSPTIIVTIAVADSIHLMATMFHFMRLGHHKEQAIRESLKNNWQPILLTNCTTIIGFLTMNFSDAPPLRDLGNIAAIGVAFACILTLTFLPAIMTILPIRVKPKEIKNTSVMNHLALFVIEHRKVLLFANILIAIFFTSFISRNELNDDYVKYFDETVDFRRATDFLGQHMGGLYTIELSIHAKEEGGINDPIYLHKLEQFSTWLKQQPEVIHVNVLTDIFKRLNKNMHGDDQEWYKLPDQRDLAAQYFLTYEMSLPYGLDMNTQINVNKSATRIIVTLNTNNSNQMLDVESRLNGWLRQNMAEAKTEMSSAGLMFAHIGKRNSSNMVLGSTFELALISIILTMAFRSIKLGLISLVPNLIPAGIAFGIWGLINSQIGLGISVVASITFGIILDDTIHFISKYRRGRVELGLNSQDAVYYASSTVGEALWMTTVILVSGFIALSFSPFALNAGMGLLSAITISIALFIDLFFLPPLLMYLDKK